MEPAEITECDTCNGALSIGAATSAYGAMAAVNLDNGFAWCAYDLSELWKLEVRGDNRVVHGVDGQRAYGLSLDRVIVQVPLVVVGKYDQAGALNVDAVAGLTVTLRYLRVNLEHPVSTGNGTRTATWTQADGAVVTAPVKVIPPLEHRVGQGALCRAVLTLDIPGGRWV